MGILENQSFSSAEQGFPNDPIFLQLARLSCTVSEAVIYDDYGIEKGYESLLDDVTHLRHVLREQLPYCWFDDRGILRPDAGAIAAVAASGYYFLVGFLTIAALGGKYVPLPIAGPSEKTAYFLDKIDATFCLSEPNVADQARAIENHQKAVGRQLHIIPIQRVGSPLYATLKIDETITLPKSDTLLVLFTSGSTGLPKAVAIPRQRFFFKGHLDRTGLHLSYRPMNWIGSAMAPIKRILQGGRIRFLRQGTGPPAAQIWEALKEGSITSMSMPPIVSKALKDHYHSTILHLPSEEHNRYIYGTSKLLKVFTSGSVLNPDTAQFWKELTNMPIVAAYAMTELAGATLMAPPGTPFIDRCIGEPTRDAKIKLSGGDVGELCVKVPGMFTHYIGDEEATMSAFDDEGFFRTGDIVCRVGSQYFFQGRASCDWIRYSFFTISVIELEQRLTSLPYISEAYVFPIMDYEVRELAAAVVRLKTLGLDHERASEINLQKIRQDLSSTTELYKLPTFLRILRCEEKVPVTDSGKASKSQMREKFFHVSGYRQCPYAVPGVEFWESAVDLSYILNARDMAKPSSA